MVIGLERRQARSADRGADDLVGLRLDQSAPVLVASTPADDAARVAVNADIVLRFSEAVRAGTGSITLTDGAGDLRTIATSDRSVRVWRPRSRMVMPPQTRAMAVPACASDDATDSPASRANGTWAPNP